MKRLRTYLSQLTLLILLLLPVMSPAQESILDVSVRIQVPETTVKACLQALQTAGGFSFSYGKEVPVRRTVGPFTRELTVRGHLELLFRNDSLDWVERGNKILILKAGTAKEKPVPQQTIRGRILDAGSLSPLAAAGILLYSEGPSRGSSSGPDGSFRFEKVGVGWHELQFSSLGYRPVSVKRLVGAGKECVLEILLEEVSYEIGEVKINSRKSMSPPLNSLAVVSGRSFSSYEVENFPGSVGDISRAVLSFPGVVSINDGQNHMVIRGNSPKGLGWRMEGIEIPNLNHFSDIGASGGGISVLSNNMLDRSDFLTGAFPAEYGNALSGVFDLRLRTGNNERHERTVQLGLLGLEAMVEGPLGRESGATYIAQYRYSTLKAIHQAGITLESVPDFQDLSFKFYLPTRKTGTFSLFGIGGLSNELGARGYESDSDMYTVGISHVLSAGSKTSLKSVLAVSARTFEWYETHNLGTEENPEMLEGISDILDQNLRASFLLNRKLGSRHRIRSGLVYEMAWNRSYMGYTGTDYESVYVDDQARAATLEAHLSWSWQPAPGLTLNNGVHFIRFYLNGHYSVEPRVGLQWAATDKHTFSAGLGVHSRKEAMTLYLGQMRLSDGSIIQPNLDLELSKSLHTILGHAWAISQHLGLRTEIYYQYLYNIPAYPFPPYFTTMNFDYGYEGSPLLNYGTGYNAGLEINLERQMDRQLGFLWNATVYDSRYWDRTGRLLHTKYNGRYSSTGTLVKEFRVGKAGRHSLSLSSRYILAGGLRYLPIDEEASAAAGKTVRTWDDGFTGKWDDYFRIDLMIKFRRNRKRVTSEWSLDIQNLLSRQNALSHYWDNALQEIHYTHQNPLLPFISYRIQF